MAMLNNQRVNILTICRRYLLQKSYVLMYRLHTGPPQCCCEITAVCRWNPDACWFCLAINPLKALNMNFWLKSAYVSPQTIRSIRSIMIHQYIYVDEIDFIRVCFPSISAEENLVFPGLHHTDPFRLDDGHGRRGLGRRRIEDGEGRPLKHGINESWDQFAIHWWW